MEPVRQFMLDAVEQAFPLNDILKLNLHMGGQGKDVGTDCPDVEMVDIRHPIDPANELRDQIN